MMSIRFSGRDFSNMTFSDALAATTGKTNTRKAVSGDPPVVLSNENGVNHLDAYEALSTRIGEQSDELQGIPASQSKWSVLKTKTVHWSRQAGVQARYLFNPALKKEHSDQAVGGKVFNALRKLNTDFANQTLLTSQQELDAYVNSFPHLKTFPRKRG